MPHPATYLSQPEPLGERSGPAMQRPSDGESDQASVAAGQAAGPFAKSRGWKSEEGKQQAAKPAPIRKAPEPPSRNRRPQATGGMRPDPFADVPSKGGSSPSGPPLLNGRSEEAAQRLAAPPLAAPPQPEPKVQLEVSRACTQQPAGPEQEAKQEEEAEEQEGRQPRPLGPTMTYKSSLELEMEDWSEQRRQAAGLLKSNRFDAIMGTVIASNVVLMLVEADQRAEVYPEDPSMPAIQWLNRLLLLIYTVEASLRLYVERWNYPKNQWNCLDAFIISFGYFDELVFIITQGGDLPAAQMLPMLRILRIARLMRAIRLLRFYPELYIMIRGFIGAMKAMFYGFVLIIMLLILWSLISVEIVHPINMDMWGEMRGRGEEVDDFCITAFGSVFKAAILFFQTLVAGDSWGRCTLPIIDYVKPTFFIFAMALVSVSLGFMNLILAVIVDHAAAARDGDKEEKVKEKKKEEERQLNHWKEVIKQIDMDDNGTISWDELMNAFDENPEVKDTLSVIGIDKDDLAVMFKLMDDDGSGDLDYDEFIDAFLKAQGQDLRIYLMMTRLQCDHVAKMIKKVQGDLHAAGIAMPPSPAHGPSNGASEQPARQVPPAAPVGQLAGSFDLQADFLTMNARIQEQFDVLARSIEMNTSMLHHHTRVLEEAVTQPGQLQPAYAEAEPYMQDEARANGNGLAMRRPELVSTGCQTKFTAKRSMAGSSPAADGSLNRVFNVYSSENSLAGSPPKPGKYG